MPFFLVEVLAVIVGVIIADVIFDVAKNLWHRRQDDIKCEICQKPRKTRKTNDKKLWACRSCRKLYNEEHRD